MVSNDRLITSWTQIITALRANTTVRVQNGSGTTPVTITPPSGRTISSLAIRNTGNDNIVVSIGAHSSVPSHSFTLGAGEIWDLRLGAFASLPSTATIAVSGTSSASKYLVDGVFI